MFGTQSFTATAPIFQGENWIRAEIVAYAPQFTDSLLAGTYGTLDVGQSGSWTYSLSNGLGISTSLTRSASLNSWAFTT